MLDILGMTMNLRRPKLLARAAKVGARDYDRSRDLARVLQTERLPRSGEALMMLLDMESVQNAARLAKAPEYRVSVHVQTLIAISGEAALYRASLAPVLVT